MLITHGSSFGTDCTVEAHTRRQSSLIFCNPCPHENRGLPKIETKQSNVVSQIHQIYQRNSKLSPHLTEPHSMTDEAASDPSSSSSSSSEEQAQTWAFLWWPLGKQKLFRTYWWLLNYITQNGVQQLCHKEDQFRRHTHVEVVSHLAPKEGVYKSVELPR